MERPPQDRWVLEELQRLRWWLEQIQKQLDELKRQNHGD